MLLPLTGPRSAPLRCSIAYSTGYAGKDVPYVSWTDEYGNNTLPVPVGTSAIVPVRIAGGTKVWIHTYPGDTTWYAVIVFGAPAKGSGPFGDYEGKFTRLDQCHLPELANSYSLRAALAQIFCC